MPFRFERGTSPALLLLHGTGGDENDLIPLGQLIRPGAALLSPRGEVDENGQLRFFRRLAPGVFDLDDLIRRTHALADLVEEQSERHHLHKIVAVGYSNGANFAASMLILRPGILSGAIRLRAGRHDAMIPQESTQRLAVLLEQAGANVTLEWRNTGHGLEQHEFAFARDWLAQRFPHQL